MENISWNKGTIEHPKMPEGGRNLNTYEANLGFKRRELEGLKVLDLGAGPQIKFSEELKTAGIKADVISFSPDFLNEKYVLKARGVNSEAKLVAGLGQKMPFADESFDRVMCLNVYDHLPTREDFLKMILEIIRVLKDQGAAHIGPFETFLDKKSSSWGVNKPYHYLMDSNEIKNILKLGNVNISHEELDGTGLRIATDQKTGKKFRSPIERIIITKGIDKDDYL
jgi:ubiquinone/menaquinone biosynthesis C-methylase UbiE